MSAISYLRVSTVEKTAENQRQVIAAAGWQIDKEFADEAISETTAADSRRGWAYHPFRSGSRVRFLSRLGC